MIRLMFLCTADKSYLYETVLTLIHDYNLYPKFEKTFIFYGPNDTNTEDIVDLFELYNIDSSKFEFIPDQSLLNNEKYYKFGGWIFQQILKLKTIDWVDNQNILIQDCDTFFIKQYQYFDNDPIPAIHDTEYNENEYYYYTSLICGIDQQTNYSFVTEFMPYTKTAWNELKNQIEQIHSQYWLDAVFNTFEDHNHLPQIWFSEYNLLGNWLLYKNTNLKTHLQNRIEVKSLDFTLKSDTNAFSSQRLIKSPNDIDIVLEKLK